MGVTDGTYHIHGYSDDENTLKINIGKPIWSTAPCRVAKILSKYQCVEMGTDFFVLPLFEYDMWTVERLSVNIPTCESFKPGLPYVKQNILYLEYNTNISCVTFSDDEIILKAFKDVGTVLPNFIKHCKLSSTEFIGKTITTEPKLLNSVMPVTLNPQPIHMTPTEIKNHKDLSLKIQVHLKKGKSYILPSILRKEEALNIRQRVEECTAYQLTIYICRPWRCVFSYINSQYIHSVGVFWTGS